VLEVQNGMRWGVWTSVCCLALLTSTCAHQQQGTRLVYLPSPPAATSAAPEPDSGTLVIEEPAKPELEELPFAKHAEVLNVPPTTPLLPPKTTSASSSPPDFSVEEPLVKLPPLEPANNPGEGRRQQLEKTQHDMGLSIERFGRAPLSNPERQTLGEAKAFLDQSKAALHEGDLPRAEKLAEKARLLITALEQRR
jgi:hypothetical protein